MGEKSITEEALMEQNDESFGVVVNYRPSGAGFEDIGTGVDASEYVPTYDTDDWQEIQTRLWTKLVEVSTTSGWINDFIPTPNGMLAFESWEEFDFDTYGGYLGYSETGFTGEEYIRNLSSGERGIAAVVYVLDTGTEYAYLYIDTENRTTGTQIDFDMSVDTTTYGYDALEITYPTDMQTVLTDRFGGLAADENLDNYVMESIATLATSYGAALPTLHVDRFISRHRLLPSLSSRFPYEMASDVTSSAQTVTAATDTDSGY